MPYSFFKDLKKCSLLNDYSDVIDWLLDENKFSETNVLKGKYANNLTRNIKKYNEFSKANICELNNKNSEKLVADFKYSENRTSTILITINDGFTKSLIKHIRNSIAHGKAKIQKNGQNIYLLIEDFNGKRQTALIYMPLDYLKNIYNDYQKILKSMNNTKAVDRNKNKSKRRNK